MDALETVNKEHKKLVDGITILNSQTMKLTLSSLANASDEISQAIEKYQKAFEVK